MHAGEIVQVGAPRAVYARPVNRVVAAFMGLVNLISGRVVRAGADGGVVAVGGEHPIDAPVPPGVAAGQTVQGAIRPENLRLIPATAADGAGSVPGRVVEATFLGNIVDCHVALADGTRVRIQVDPGQTPEVGQCVGIRFDGRQSSVFG
jgi:ABC-type Fe3+/spermidine/putrescine transport system ATPase subunit